ncbi:MAG: ABC transporter substrate-binding protein, partial [Deltaproteobacteria bacterium]|nr:ABC transporter substrate-binding protein [Deltaproteobacteria bacterium]
MPHPIRYRRSRGARASLIALLSAMAFLTVTLSPAATAAQERQRVRMTQPVATLTLLVIYLARGNQYFEGEGLAVDVISTGGGGPDVQALLAGNVDFTATAIPLVINSYLQGKPLLGVVNILNRSNMDVVIRKDLAEARGIRPEMSIEAKIQALKGLTVGVTRMGALTQQVGFYFIRKAGLEPQKDIRIVGMGGDMAVLAGLENRKIDAFVMSPPLPEM